ncbi:WhiB family transcriptional regulator [Streptomyces sp. NPDC005576]|uniref:WhiB family transcriptional regulator n=1 Tax=Streptomyces sp. NPDC005576 TaxID=3364726 RepID=UPI00368E1433
MTLTRNAKQVVAAAGPAGVPACQGVDPELFFPEASELRNGLSAAELAALAVCAGCPVVAWCLSRDLAECTVASRVRGVRGGLRQAERRALHVELFGRRPKNGATA